MATIVFCVPEMLGEVNATLQLANWLRDRGHKVVYFGVESCEKYLRSSNFPFISLVSQPESPEIDEIKKQFQTLKGIRRLAQSYSLQRQIISDHDSFNNRLLSDDNNEVRKIISDLSPDLFLITACVDNNLTWVFLAHKYGIRSAYLTTTFDLPINSYIPPHTSSLIPSDTLTGRAKVLLAWAKRIASYQAGKLQSRLLGFYKPSNLRKWAEMSHCSDKDISWKYIIPRLNLPEIILFAPQIDFPKPNPPARVYIGMCVLLDRDECAFPWERLNPDLPLVFCALGNLADVQPMHRKRFIETVLQVATTNKYQQWVISLGSRLSEQDFSHVPSSVILVQHAPQIALLKRAAVMVTHGGTNSMRECIIMGVPMVTFPIFFDQFGNSARIVYHGCGVRGSFLNPSAKEIEQLVGTVLTDRTYKDRVAALGADCRAFENVDLACRAIELLITTDYFVETRKGL